MPKSKKPIEWTFTIEELNTWHSHEDECQCEACKKVRAFYDKPHARDSKICRDNDSNKYRGKSHPKTKGKSKA